MNHRENVDSRWLEQVNDSIRVLDQLANCLLSGLRDLAPEFRKIAKCLGARQKPIDHALCLKRRGARDMARHISQVLKSGF